jgi:hypothetical protein
VAYDDSQIGLEVDGKRWAGENYGMQSEESYNKLFVAGKLNPVQQKIDRVGNYISNSAKADPIVGPALEFLGNSASAITNVLPEPIKQGVGFVLDKNQEAAENIAAATGLPVSLTDPSTIADVATGGATLAAKPAVKTAVRETIQGASTIGRNLTPPKSKLALAGDSLRQGGVVPDFAPSNVMALTIKDPKLIAKGVKKGSARSAEWLPQTRDFDMRRAALREKVASSTSKSGKSNAISDMYDGVSTGPTRDPQGNPYVYKNEDFKERSLVEKLKDGSAKWKEQHHLFSKQESFQFVERMVELGDDDDVLNMFLFAEDLDASMGGRLKNMLNMERKPHNLLHTSRKRKIDGRELKSDEMKNLVMSAKSSTELMELFNKYVTGNVTDSIMEAKAFNEIGNRMIKSEQYGWINELYDKNMLRKPVYRPY